VIDIKATNPSYKVLAVILIIVYGLLYTIPGTFKALYSKAVTYREETEDLLKTILNEPYSLEISKVEIIALDYYKNDFSTYYKEDDKDGKLFNVILINQPMMAFVTFKANNASRELVEETLAFVGGGPVYAATPNGRSQTVNPEKAGGLYTSGRYDELARAVYSDQTTATYKTFKAKYYVISDTIMVLDDYVTVFYVFLLTFTLGVWMFVRYRRNYNSRQYILKVQAVQSIVDDIYSDIIMPSDAEILELNKMPCNVWIDYGSLWILQSKDSLFDKLFKKLELYTSEDDIKSKLYSTAIKLRDIKEILAKSDTEFSIGYTFNSEPRELAFTLPSSEFIGRLRAGIRIECGIDMPLKKDLRTS
jgi:hypothetical protein